MGSCPVTVAHEAQLCYVPIMGEGKDAVLTVEGDGGPTALLFADATSLHPAQAIYYTCAISPQVLPRIIYIYIYITDYIKSSKK